MSKTEKPVCVELDRLLAEAKSMKPKHNLTPEQMDELNERLLGTLKPK